MLVGDSATASRHPFLRRLVDYMNSNAEVYSGFDYGAAGPTASHGGGAGGAITTASGSGGPGRELKEEAEVEAALRARLTTRAYSLSLSLSRMGSLDSQA